MRISDGSLDEAIALLRSELALDVLSAASRGTIFEQARRPAGALESLAASIPRAWTLALAASFPLAVTLALLLPLQRPPLMGKNSIDFPRIIASKDDGNVVFTVANGRSDHHVFKSTDPARFGAKEVKEVGGRFEDPTNNGVELVFYRVD